MINEIQDETSQEKPISHSEIIKFGEFHMGDENKLYSDETGMIRANKRQVSIFLNQSYYLQPG